MVNRIIGVGLLLAAGHGLRPQSPAAIPPRFPAGRAMTLAA